VSNKGKDIAYAASLLMAGRAVGIPTETVYGLAANALNESAVLTIFEVKKRPSFDPLIVHIGNIDILHTIVKEVTPMHEALMNAFWPGPLTLIFEKQSIIPDIVTSGLNTVGIRMPNHPLTLELLKISDLCLAAPSANPFGYISPTLADHVLQQLGDQVEYVLDGGASDIGLESTIVRCDKDQIVVLRLGGLSLESLSSLGYPVKVSDHSSSTPEAPGMLTSHYAPRKKTYYYSADFSIDDRTSVLYFSKKSHRSIDRTLSESGNVREAAHQLFKYLRELDELDIDQILVEKAPPIGLGLAINDRLKRATAS
jgi:L-threonylcarbamoyladenylate synthase